MPLGKLTVAGEELATPRALVAVDIGGVFDFSE
jgi:hypothetical protein